MADKAEKKVAEKAKEEVKEEPKEEVKEVPKEKLATKVWTGVGWKVVEEDSPDYKAGKQPQA
jgi:hypothetical protein|tara:strand:+ start:408 stop:593 length:186 start_codon:yes stop_codon:yes gene_type:complete